MKFEKIEPITAVNCFIETKCSGFSNVFPEISTQRNTPHTQRLLTITSHVNNKALSDNFTSIEQTPT